MKAKKLWYYCKYPVSVRRLKPGEGVPEVHSTFQGARAALIASLQEDIRFAQLEINARMRDVCKAAYLEDPS